MKNLLYLSIALLGLVSCSKKSASQATDNVSISKTVEVYQLTKFMGRMRGSQLEGANLPYQEVIRLYPEGNFVKTRKTAGEEKKASGSYTLKTLSDGEYLEFEYEQKSELIGNCTGDLKEMFRVQDEEHIAGTWQMCDGPGLVYKKL